MGDGSQGSGVFHRAGGAWLGYGSESWTCGLPDWARRSCWDDPSLGEWGEALEIAARLLSWLMGGDQSKGEQAWFLFRNEILAELSQHALIHLPHLHPSCSLEGGQG